MWLHSDWRPDLGESVGEVLPVTGADAVLQTGLQPSSHHSLSLQSMSCDADAETVIRNPATSNNPFIHSFIHSSYFYSASSSPLLLRGAPDTARILCRSFTLKRQGQLQVKDLPKVPTWWLDRDSNLRPFGRKVSNLLMSHHAPQWLSISDIPLYLCYMMIDEVP